MQGGPFSPAATPSALPSSCRGRRRRLQIDQHLAVLHLGLVGLEIDEAGRLHRLAARHVKRAEVKAAFDRVAVERAIGEIGKPMGAARLGGVEGAADIVDRDELVADLAADHAVLRDIGNGADGNGICHGVSGALQR